MRRLSFKQKLWMPLVISLIGLLSIGAVNAYHARELMISERQVDIIHADQMALSIVKQYAAFAEAGKMSEADAKREALERLKVLRFGTDGFFVVDDFNAHVVMHSDAPSFNGRDMSAFTDKQGRHVHQMVSQLAREQGSGFVNYISPHFLGGTPVPKISYVMAYKPWQWAVFTGAYLDDINEAVLASLLFPALVLVGVVAVLSLFIALAARNIQKQLGGDPAYASMIAGRIATGNLAVDIKTRPDDHVSLLANMKSMRDGLVRTIEGITRSADNVALAAGEINAGNSDLSRRTEVQASSLGETAASMEQITGMVKQTADATQRATSLAGDAAMVTDRSGEMVGQVVQAMRDMSNQSSKMVEIISVIEGIAFQTNILALNAAVEAARAGEKGRGFAVVAGEVRTLARRSADASKEIRELIQNSVNRIKAGSSLVEHAGATMKEAQGALSRVSTIIGEIEVAAQEQHVGIERISEAVAQMDEVTQQNAALVEQSSAAAHSLEQLAGDLRTEMAAFRLTADEREIETGGGFAATRRPMFGAALA